MFLRDTADIINNIALVDEHGRQVTYRDLEDQSRIYQDMICKRSLVFILCDYNIDSIIFYYSIMNNHVVPLLLDEKINGKVLHKLIKLYEPQFIWIKKDRASEVPIQCYVIKELTEHIILKTDYEGCELYEELALLLTTSGSTGSPKLVRVSYDNLINNAKAFVKATQLKDTDIGITTLPMHFSYGLAVMHLHWMAGAQMCLTDMSMLKEEFWLFLQEQKVTNFAGVPYTYEILFKIGFLDKIPMSLRFLTEGGGKLPDDRQRLFGKKLMEKNVRLLLCYGQTECTGLIAVLSSQMILDKIGSVGSVVEGMEVLSGTKKDYGEVILKGTSVSLGYAENKTHLIKGNENNGVLYTGDIGYIEEGYLYLTGRKKRIVKILGIRVNMDDIENILGEAFIHCEFACVGKDNQLKIYYTGSSNNEENIYMFCKEQFTFPRRLLEVVNIRDIPRNSAGKKDYQRFEIR